MASTRLSIGEPGSFVIRVLALSSLVALLVGSIALRDVVPAAIPGGAGQGVGELSSALLGEVDSLIAVWLVPVWALVAAASFVVTLDSARSFGGTVNLLSQLGSGGKSRSVVALRGAILAALSLLVGLSLGVVAAQVVFRVFVVVLGAQYFVPVLSPDSLGVAAGLVLSALFVGTVSGTLAARPVR